MGLLAYNKAIGLMKGDIIKIIISSFNSVSIDPASLKRILVEEFSKQKIWIWNNFRFSIMRVSRAVSDESEARIIEEPSSREIIPIPGIGFSVVGKTSSGYHYEIIIQDSTPNSQIASNIRNRLGIEHGTTENHNGVYSFIYDFYAD